MPEKAKSSAKKPSAKAADKPVAKKTATTAVKKDKKPAIKETTASVAPAKKRSASPRKKEKLSAEPQSSGGVSTTRDVLEVAAYLNWCSRRNQGLPDDALADWISAEMLNGLAN